MLRREFVSLAAVPAMAQEQPDIRVDVNLVNVPFSVRDGRGHLVLTLTREDLEVLEDGVPQTITHFSKGGASALSLGLVADASGSQKDFLKDHRRDLRDFLKSVGQARDQAFLVCFGNQPRLVSGLTGQMEQIHVSLEQFQKDTKYKLGYPVLGPRENRTGGTAFYDAIYHAVEDVLAKVESGRRTLIVFSDGEDNASAHHMLDVIEAAQRAGVQVFGIRYTEVRRGLWTGRNKYGRSVMERIARETGGLDLDATGAVDLKSQFRQIADILRASYDLAYSSTSPPDGSFRKVRIRAKGAGLSFRHKTGYYARAD